MRRILAAMAFAALGLNTGQGLAQEDLNKGKTPQQLYASDCVECHKNPRALGNRDNPGSLSNFLRVHYTASRESASALAAYLVSLGPDPRGARPAAAGAGTASRPRPAATPEQGKSELAKPAAASNEEAKPAEAAKPAEPEQPKEQEKAAPAAAAPPASEPAPAAPAAAPAAPPADPQ